jgi:transposase
MTKQTNSEVSAKPTRRIFSGTEKRRILTAADAFDKWLVAVEATLLPSDPLMVAIRYNRRHREALYRFIDDADVPIDNSPPEREFQNVGKLRLNMLFAGSKEGAHRACVLLGIVGSCRVAGVQVQAYLAWAPRRDSRRAAY